MQPQHKRHGAVTEAVRKALKSVRSADGTFKVAEVIAKVETEVPGTPRPTVYSTIARLSQHVKNGTRRVVTTREPTSTPGARGLPYSADTNKDGRYYTMRGGWTKTGDFISTKAKIEIVRKELRKVWDLFPKTDGFVARADLIGYCNHLGISYVVTQEALSQMVSDGEMEKDRQGGGQRDVSVAFYRFTETPAQAAEPEPVEDRETTLHVAAGTIEDVDAAIDAWLDRRIKERLAKRLT